MTNQRYHLSLSYVACVWLVAAYVLRNDVAEAFPLRLAASPPSPSSSRGSIATSIRSPLPSTSRSRSPSTRCRPRHNNQQGTLVGLYPQNLAEAPDANCWHERQDNDGRLRYRGRSHAAAATGGRTSLHSSVAMDSYVSTPFNETMIGGFQDVRDSVVTGVDDMIRDNMERIAKAKEQQQQQGAGAAQGAVTADDAGTDSSVPTFGKLLKFASTSILIWLSEPLLSIVDTTVVGRMAGPDAVIQLASLGPATTLMDTLLYMTYFLAIATTNKVARQLANQDYRQLQRTTSHILATAAIVGLGITATVFLAGPALITSLAGASVSPQLVQYATRYARIRALVASAAVMQMVSQSFLLTTMNTRIVAISVAVASIINISGDLLLRSYGVVGAAAATAVAGLSSSLLLLRAVKKQMNQWRRQELEGVQETAAEECAPDASPGFVAVGPSDGSSRSHSSTASDVDANKKPVPFLSLPDRKSVLGLLKLSAPLAFNMWGKMFSYSALTVAATRFGVVPLATHNIMLRVFWLLGCLSDCLGQTAQAFLPAMLYPKLSKINFNKTWRKLFVLAACAAAVGSRVSTWMLSSGAGLLARDGLILQTLRNNHLFLTLALVLHPFIVLQEGAVIAKRDFKNLFMTYSATLVTHFTILRFFCGSFPGVWRTLFVWQLSRLAHYNIWKSKRPLEDADTKTANADPSPAT